MLPPPQSEGSRVHISWSCLRRHDQVTFHLSDDRKAMDVGLQLSRERWTGPTAESHRRSFLSLPFGLRVLLPGLLGTRLRWLHCGIYIGFVVHTHPPFSTRHMEEQENTYPEDFDPVQPDPFTAAGMQKSKTIVCSNHHSSKIIVYDETP